jgi:rhodanese-related sulfurtransferase
MQLVDVRSQAEWTGGHLPGAVSVPLLDLASETEQIDRSRPTLVYCREGYRATTAASILLRQRFDNIAILVDGVEGGSALGLPLAMAEDPFDRSALCTPE